MKNWKLVLLTSATLTACSSTPPVVGLKDREPAFFSRANQELSADDILKAASSTALQVDKARLITDNDAAFDSKLKAIREAKAGETIRMTYYIYSQDHSSSVFSEELLKAAKRGVKVRLMVDFLTNYKLLDLFTYLETESKGAIQVKLYGRPNSIILRDVVYMSQPCPESNGQTVSANTCSDYKWKNLKTDSPDYFARLLLSGIYGKSAGALQTGLLKGQQIDLAAMKSGSAMSDEDQKDLQEFFKLLFQAKAKNDTVAKVKVAIAMQMYASKLNPLMYEIYGRLPIQQMGDGSAREWEHISDYTHHKVLIVGNRYVQLGGRNIENSYHMKPNSLTEKYIFMDTDMALDLNGGGDSIVKAYDDLWNFSAMSVPVAEVRQFMPNDFIANVDVAVEVAQKCTPEGYKTVSQRQQLQSCIEASLPQHPKFMNLAKRLAAEKETMRVNANTYRTTYLPKKKYTQTWKRGTAYNDEIDRQDVKNMLVAYVENVPYDRAVSTDRRQRKYGAVAGNEMKDGKYIHALWYKGLENACAVSAREQKQKRVILHSAYLLPPALLMKGFTKMIDGSWDCRNVHMTFLTNSMETTDLNVINVVARYQMMAFFEVYNSRESIYGKLNAQRSAQIDYYEYKKPEGSANLSLHTKLSVLGDDMIVGSANADVRSYYMDSNNGFYLHNADGLAAEYSQWVDSLLKDPSVTVNLTPLYTSGQLTWDRLRAEDKQILEVFAQRWKTESPLKQKSKEAVWDLMGSLGKFVVDTTRMIMSKDFIIVDQSGEIDQSDRKKLEEQAKREKQFNSLLQVL